jgi:large subunit ribosomal protein L11
MAQTVETVVDGGKVAAGPLGPSLGPTGVNIGEVVAMINQKTAAYNGMKVPVKIMIDDKKGFEIKIGTPPASALVKQEAGISSGSGNPKTTFVADLTIDQIKKIVEMKFDDLQGASVKTKANEIVGTCTSCGVTVDGVNPREASKAIRAGEWDHKF